MNFNRHSNLKGQHAFLSASKYHWINYDYDKLLNAFNNFQAAQKGTELHDLACRLINLNVRLPRVNKTLNMYVNDAIGFQMETELVLYYSDNCFGTCDAISFKKNLLRIHDYKSGTTPAHMEQLMIYAALYCLEYRVKPNEIKMELRIYQNDEIQILEPDADDIFAIMDKIVEFDKYINEPSRYDVESGCLRCKRNGSALWCIPIDNHGADCVSVWLGDLGSLPYAQQLHFASQNVSKGEVSDTFFRSQIDAEFCDSPHPVAVFKSSYYKLRTVGWEELGWHLLLPLTEQDQHYMSALKLLTHNEQKEFDEQILALTKILIDSLNEKELRRFLSCDERGISLFDKALKQRNVLGLEQHVKFLRDLQDIRSTFVAHRKGEKYIRVSRRIGLDRLSLSEVLKRLFVEGINFLQFLTENIDKFK